MALAWALTFLSPFHPLALSSKTHIAASSYHRSLGIPLLPQSWYEDSSRRVILLFWTNHFTDLDSYISVYDRVFIIILAAVILAWASTFLCPFHQSALSNKGNIAALFFLALSSKPWHTTTFSKLTSGFVQETYFVVFAYAPPHFYEGFSNSIFLCGTCFFMLFKVVTFPKISFASTTHFSIKWAAGFHLISKLFTYLIHILARTKCVFDKNYRFSLWAQIFIC